MEQHERTAESQYKVCTPGTPAPAAAAPLRKLAVFVTHGMGQQVPFATLDAVFERLRRLEPYSSARPEAETVRLGGQQMQRLVLRLPAHNREIHFYEGYWAPLTEGEVTLRDISAFLLRAGLNGILNSTTTLFPLDLRSLAVLRHPGEDLGLPGRGARDHRVARPDERRGSRRERRPGPARQYPSRMAQ